MTQSLFLIDIGLPQPGLGVGVTYRLPQSLGLCRVALVTVRFVTGVTVAVRSVFLNATSPQGDTKGRAASHVTQVAGVTRRYTWGLTGTAYSDVAGDNAHLPLQGLFLLGGDTLLVDADLITVTDQFDRGFCWLELIGPTSRPGFPPDVNPGLPTGR